MPKKVFEFAKELDMKPLDLVEKLKDMGFSVRNHMNSLKDDEVVKALSIFKEADDEAKKAAPKKKTKRKVTKKVAKKKKVTKKALETVKAKSDEDKETSVKEVEKVVSAEKKTTKKTATVRKTVLRRKAAKDKVQEESSSFLSELVSDDNFNIESGATTQTKVDKQHSFTPVYIPEDEVQESPEGQIKEQGGSVAADKKKPRGLQIVSTADVVEKKPGQDKVAVRPKTGAAEADQGESDKKKRIGGLAAMMAKPKVGTSKNRELAQFRADEEMKTYTVGILGKAVYTPIGRKKIYSGSKRETKKTEVKESKRYIVINGSCTGKELAQKLQIKFNKLCERCLEMNLLIDQEDFFGIILASEIAELYDYRVRDKAFDEESIIEGNTEEMEEGKSKKNDFPLRDPIVTVMGHVDHGKTTLLDYIRETKVASGEAGGITQHIGAYSVKVKDSQITFLDTPGHAAFSRIRERGANITDIVILIVAADDGVMPQTKESIRFCQRAEVPMIIAVNKIDKDGVNPDRVKQELMEFNITPEEWGGDTQFIGISALKGDGIDDLLEAIALQTEIMELKANPKGNIKGVVIESRVEQGRGPVCTVLVQEGTLKKGNYVVAGETYGRARSLMDYSGNILASAGPSTPVQILGLDEAASPGDTINVVKNERECKKIVENRIDDRKKLAAVQTEKVSLEDFFATAQITEEKKVLKLIIRTDVQGSFEAIKTSIEAIGNAEVGVAVIDGGVGAISDKDVMLASSAQGYVIGFNMRPVTSARRLAEEKGVDIKNYSIIYELINDITLALEGMLEPDQIEKYIGRAEVKDLFVIPKIGTIAGSSVVDGKIQRGCNIRLIRDGKTVYEGKMSSLKRFKDDVKEVGNGLECGISLENYNDIKVSDLFEAYNLEEKKRKLEIETAL